MTNVLRLPPERRLWPGFDQCGAAGRLYDIQGMCVMILPDFVPYPYPPGEVTVYCPAVFAQLSPLALHLAASYRKNNAFVLI